ncbi:MAG: hypothetical protein ACE37K_11185 [Planctomycetota bacterium]
MAEVFSVVLESDKDSPRPTTFRIGVLSHRTMLALPSLKEQEQVELVVRAGVRGWDGMADAQGRPVEAVRVEGSQMLFGVEVEKPLALSSYDSLPADCIAELAEQVVKQNRTTQEDVGK